MRHQLLCTMLTQTPCLLNHCHQWSAMQQYLRQNFKPYRCHPLTLSTLAAWQTSSRHTAWTRRKQCVPPRSLPASLYMSHSCPNQPTLTQALQCPQASQPLQLEALQCLQGMLLQPQLGLCVGSRPPDGQALLTAMQMSCGQPGTGAKGPFRAFQLPTWHSVPPSPLMPPRNGKLLTEAGSGWLSTHRCWVFAWS